MNNKNKNSKNESKLGKSTLVTSLGLEKSAVVTSSPWNVCDEHK